MYFTQGKTDCQPADVGYNESRITVLNSHFQKLIDEGEIQCASYCLSRKGKIFAHGAVGRKSFRKEDKTPLDPTNITRIASITKLFTTVAILKLVEDGITKLDAPVGEILPQFDSQPFNKINLFHLLTHTSGMHPDLGTFPNKYEKSAWDLISDGYKLHGKEDGDFDWIAASLVNGVRAKPGEQWLYCTFGFVILGAVIEKLTGVFANKYIEENIVKPLKMTDTCFDESMTAEQAKRSIVNNEWREGFLNGVINVKADGDEDYKFWKKIPETGGGLNSTPRDLIRFANMMLNMGSLDGVRIVGRKAAEKMTRQAVFNIPDNCWGAGNPDRAYGVGFDMRHGHEFTFTPGTYNHEGAGASALYIDPAEDFAAAWFVPFAKEGWFARATVNASNIMWSGLI